MAASRRDALAAPPRSVGRLLVLSLASLLLAGGALELLLRQSGIDRALVLKVVPFQAADIPVHRRSEDPFLHYELKPGARYRGELANKPPYRVSIDEFGARFPTHRMEKAPGVFRILAFGGSTLYGAAVDDEDTIAAALERRLNARPPDTVAAGRRFEVWNFGTSAYTLGQAAHHARLKLPVLSPDLVLVLDHNRTRRTFLMPESSRPEHYPYELLLADPHFYAEQFYSPEFIPIGLHLSAMSHSAAYRAAVAAIVLNLGLHQYEYPAKLSSDESRLLSEEASARGVPVVYFAIPANRGGLGPQSVFPELPPVNYIDLYRPDADPVFYEPHPPASTLAEFAALLGAELERRRFVPS